MRIINNLSADIFDSKEKNNSALNVQINLSISFITIVFSANK